MPYALYCGGNRLSTKRKKERLTDEVSILRFVCKPFLFCSLPISCLFFVVGCLSNVWQRKQMADGMNLNYTIGYYSCHRKQTT